VLKPEKIIIHHSLTKDGAAVSWGAIHSYHVNEKGWSDIGYHAGIEEVDGRFICMFGRPDWLPGAHTRGQNGRSLGFCFVGDYDRRRPDDARLRVAARRVLVPWLLRYRLGVDALVPHHLYASKSCPGTRFPMDRLRTICAEELDRAQVS
jgi:N-acetylmuramoyl-L-alanine amidase